MSIPLIYIELILTPINYIISFITIDNFIRKKILNL